MSTYVVAITGASGSIYGIRLLKNLPGKKILVISKTGKMIIPTETEYSVEDVYAMADEVYEDDDLFACISSGSFRYDCLFVVPCSGSSIAKFASGIADTLISRAVSVRLKESKRMVIVPRETPKSRIMLSNELTLAQCGVILVDANPGFYNKPQTIDDMIDFVVGRCLDAADIENSLYRRWE